MTSENNGLKIGEAYNLKIKDRDFGRCLYLGKKMGKGVVYKNVIIRRGGEVVFGIIFNRYSLTEDELTISRYEKRSAKLSPNERKYLDERLKKAGL